MSKKEERYRVEGFQMAYHLMKEAGDYEKGLRKLESRLTKSQQTNMPILIRDQELQQYENNVKYNVFLTLSALCLMVLREDFGFGSKRGERFMSKFVELSDIVYGGWLEWDNEDPEQPGIIQYLQSEMRCDIRAYLELAAQLRERTERQLEMRDEFLENRQKWLKRLKKPWQKQERGLEKL